MGSSPACNALPVPLVWVTGNSGVGKSTVCALLKDLGELAIDADWEDYNHWVDRASGQVVADPPYPVPAGWLERFAWKISRAEVKALAARMHDQTAFLVDPPRTRQTYGTSSTSWSAWWLTARRSGTVS